MIAAEAGFAHDILEGDVGRAGHRDRQRAPGRAVGIARRLEQHLEVGALHHLGLVAVIEHGETRRHVGLERKLLQQPGAQRVDGLHLEPAGRFQCGGEQFAGAHPQARIDPRDPRIDDRGVQRLVIERDPVAEGGETRSAMLAAAALVKVMQRIFSGGTLSSSSRITRCTSTWVLPDPALAETNADEAGSDARVWVARTAGGIGRGAFTIPRSPGRRPRTIP